MNKRYQEGLKKSFGMFKYALNPKDIEEKILSEVRQKFTLSPIDSLFLESLYQEVTQRSLKRLERRIKPVTPTPNRTQPQHSQKTSIVEVISWWSCIGAFLLSLYVYLKSNCPWFSYFGK